MSKKTKIIQILLVNVVLLVVVCLSGCTTSTTEDQSANEPTNAFLGTWVGTLQMPLFGGGSNATVSQITFTSDRTVMVFSSGERTFTMNYSYKATGDTLVLTPIMVIRNGSSGTESFNGSRPPNGTMFPGNGTLPPNGTQPPGNGTWPPRGGDQNNGSWPSNGTRPPRDTRPSTTVSFTYVVSEEARELYLNNVRFIKVG